MIPKVIHYCWFGRNPLPELAVKCIESWKKYLPDYEIKEWNESNFDVNIIPYTKEAYEAKKYAFVSDYARFYILYYHGGLYFDTVVEIIKHIDDIITKGPFMGCEKDAAPSMPETGSGATAVPAVAPGLGLGCNPGLGLYAEILGLYKTLHFLKEDGRFNLKTVVDYTTELLCQQGLKNVNEIQECAGIWVYPKEWFCPMSPDGEMNLTENSRLIHHYAGSWLPSKSKIKKRIIRFLGKRISNNIVALKHHVNSFFNM